MKVLAYVVESSATSLDVKRLYVYRKNPMQVLAQVFQ